MYDFDKVIERKGSNSVKYEKEHQDNPNIIPMWVADMDFETLPEVKQALQKRVDHGIFGYAEPTDSYYQAVMSWMEQRCDFKIKKEWIVTVPGIVTALKLAVRAFTKPQDHIMIMKPVYSPFHSSIEINDRIVSECPLILRENQYACDMDLFEKTIIDDNVKMLILCNPHNPIGKVWTYDELYQIGTICKRNKVFVISDEVHMDFIYGNHQHRPFYTIDESFKEFSMICTAPSKTFNLATLQTSNILIANEVVRSLFLKEKKASGVNDPSVFGLDACEAAYTYGSKWVDELIEYLKGNIDYMIEFFDQRLPDIHIIEPQGLYLVWVDFRSLNKTNKDLEEFMLHKANLFFNEGHIFGTGGDGFERVNIACPRSVLRKALLQLEKAIKDL